MLNYILQSHYLLSKQTHLLNVGLDDIIHNKGHSLELIIFNQIIADEFIGDEEQPSFRHIITIGTALTKIAGS